MTTTCPSCGRRAAITAPPWVCDVCIDEDGQRPEASPFDFHNALPRAYTEEHP
jgi:hypothetical protein